MPFNKIDLVEGIEDILDVTKVQAFGSMILAEFASFIHLENCSKGHSSRSVRRNEPRL